MAALQIAVKRREVKSKGEKEIIQGLFSYFCGIMLEINIKRYLKITHIFSSAV